MAKFYQLGNLGEYQFPIPELSYNSVEVTPPPFTPGVTVPVWVTELSPKSSLNFGRSGTGAWVVKEDHRKLQLWDTDGNPYSLGTDKEGSIYYGVGPVPNWLTETRPTPSLLPPEIVSSVTAAQGGIALIRMDLMDMVQEAVASPDTPPEVRWAWDKATVWDRNSPALAYLANAAGITADQMDQLFDLAKTIVA